MTLILSFYYSFFSFSIIISLMAVCVFHFRSMGQSGWWLWSTFCWCPHFAHNRSPLHNLYLAGIQGYESKSFAWWVMMSCLVSRRALLGESWYLAWWVKGFCLVSHDTLLGSSHSVAWRVLEPLLVILGATWAEEWRVLLCESKWALIGQLKSHARLARETCLVNQEALQES